MLQRILIVTVLEDLEAEDFYKLSPTGLSGAYSEDEPEYSDDLIIEPNPHYKK